MGTMHLQEVALKADKKDKINETTESRNCHDAQRKKNIRDGVITNND